MASEKPKNIEFFLENSFTVVTIKIFFPKKVCMFANQCYPGTPCVPVVKFSSDIKIISFVNYKGTILHTIKSRTVDRSTIQFLSILGVLLTEMC